MSLSLIQWARVIFVDIPQAEADLDTLTVTAFAKKWVPRLEAYGFTPDHEAVTPQVAVDKISSGQVPTDVQVIIDRAGNPNAGGG